MKNNKKNDLKELFRYMLFGVLTFFVSISTYGLFNQALKVDELTANAISWIFAVVFAYITNRIWVFSSVAKGIKQVFQEMCTFFGGRAVTLVIEEVILLVFITWLKFDSMTVKIAAQVIVILLNYVISKVYVFSNKKGKKKYSVKSWRSKPAKRANMTVDEFQRVRNKN